MDLQEAFDEGFAAVKNYVDGSFSAFEARIAAIEERSPIKGDPGKDADMAEIARRIDERFSAALFDIAKEAQEREPSDLVTRVAALESRQPENGKDGADGRDGKDADADAITASILEYVMAEFKALPVPRDGIDGKPGLDGKDADADAITKNVISTVMALVEAIPAPKDGAPGRDGRDGTDANEEVITAKIMDAVITRVEAIPLPKDGEPGRNGADADSEAITTRVMESVMAKVAKIPIPKDGEPGQDGKDGSDGVGLAGALIDRDGELVVTLTDGQHKKLGVVVGKDGQMGEKGLDGRDGFGFEDMFVEYDGERAATIKFTKGDHSKSFLLVLPTVIDRGVWKEGTYERGDAVSWGGSLWIAQEETTDKPETSKAWRLAVKRGRDGKDGVMKVAAAPQPVKVS